MAKKISKARPDKKPSMAPFTNALSSSTEKERETGKVPKKNKDARIIKTKMVKICLIPVIIIYRRWLEKSMINRLFFIYSNFSSVYTKYVIFYLVKDLSPV